MSRDAQSIVHNPLDCHVRLTRAQYAEKIAVSEKMLMHMPPLMSFETAAGIPEARYPTKLQHQAGMDMR